MVVESVKQNKLLITVVFAAIILLIVWKPWEVHAQGVAKVADLPYGLYDSCCALADNGCIYIFGGEITNNQRSNSVIKFDPTDRSVSVVASMDKDLYKGWAINYNGKIYVGSGTYGTQSNNKIIIFDPLDNTINTITAPAALQLYPGLNGNEIGAILYNGKIYVFYGYKVPNYQNSVKIYDVSSNTATTVALSTDSAVKVYSLCNYSGKAYIVGWHETQGVNDTNTGVLIFNPATNVMTNDAYFAYIEGMSTCFGADGIMYAVGGYKLGSYTSDIVNYDPVTKTTNICGSIPFPRARSCSALAGDGKIYIFGGQTGDNPRTSTSEILQIDPENLSAPPGEFTLLAELGADAESADLTWTTSSNATEYIVERSTDGINFNQIEQTGGNSHMDPDLEPGTYYYRVKAQNDHGERMSNVVILTVQESLPMAPMLTVTLEDTDAALSWDEVDGATAYILERSTDGVNFKQLKQLSNNAYTDPNLTPGRYYYRVKASNSSGMSDPSNTVSVAISYIPPSKHWAYWPSGGQYVKVDWVRGNIDLTGDLVQLWREDTVSGIWLPVKDISEQEKDSFFWTDTNVSAGLNYKYQVRIYDPTTWEWFIAAESEWAVEDRPFPAPGGLKVLSKSDNSATVKWNPLSGATGYRIKISTDGGSNWSESSVSGTTANVPCPCMVQVMAGSHARSQWSGVLRVQ